MQYLTIPIKNYQLLVENHDYEFEIPSQPAIHYIKIKWTDECKDLTLMALEAVKILSRPKGVYKEYLYPQFNFDYPHDLEMSIMQDEIELFGLQNEDGIILCKNDSGEIHKLDIHPTFIARLTLGIRIIEKSINIEVNILTDEDEEFLWELSGNQFVDETIF